MKISTLLRECARTNDVVEARRLLGRIKERDRKSIVAKKNNFPTPLFVAAMRGYVDMVKCLVTEWQADVEELGRYKDRSDGSCHLVTPLWCAAISNEPDVVEVLIDHGADINASSDTGRTPVLGACAKMNIDVVKYLVMYGADIHKQDTNGETCLILAAKCSLELCQILIDNGADVNTQHSSSGNTALHCAIIN